MYEDITTEKIINTFKHTHKWKSSGIDKILWAPPPIISTSINDKTYFRNN